MSLVSAHPERLLLALDECLDHEIRLIIYGRSAIWLGFHDPPATMATTQDVDAIIPNDQVQTLANDLRFWDARDAVNERFKSEGLYITHLFPESEVFLRRDWASHIIPLTRLPLTHLKLFRPATIDLVLTKMMRGNDEQDMADVEFIIRHDGITDAQLFEAFAQINPIPLAELRDAFERAKPIVLNVARINTGNFPSS
jgi:hypothetical protein